MKSRFICLFLLITLGYPSVAATEKDSVLLITMDTLRADRLGCYGYQSSYTPCLDRFSKSSIVYSDSFTDVPLTLPAHTSLFSEVPVIVHGSIRNGFSIKSDLRLIQETFKNHGYRTAAFIGGYPLRAEFGLHRGFDIYNDDLPEEIQGSQVERRGLDVVRAAESYLESSGHPLFLWVHLYDPHHPYIPPEPYHKMVRHPYDGEIAYSDRCIEKLLRKWEDRTGGHSIQVILSDHGEALGDHNEMTHGVFLYQETIQIALMIKPAAHNTSHKPGIDTRLLPIYRIFELIQTSLMWDTSEKDQVPPSILHTSYPYDRYAWSKLSAFRENKWKYIQAPRPELYNLSLDPAERVNVIDDPVLKTSDQVSRMESILIRHIPASTEALSQEIDIHAMKALESLGYTLPADVMEPGSAPDPKDMAVILRPLDQALECINQEKWGAAMQYLEEVLSIDAVNPVATNNMGLALTRESRYQEALNFFLKSKQIQPRNHQLRNNLGVIYRKLGNYHQAAEEFRLVLEIAPSFNAARVNLAATLFSQQKYDECKHELKSAFKTDPEIIQLQVVQDLLQQLEIEPESLRD